MSHAKHLTKCIELAKQGESVTFPNPIVGAVIVYKEGTKEEKVLAASFHKQYGEAHAELNAINEAIKNGHEDLLSESTIYVSLEPCSHHGKTPPCTDLIIKHKFQKLVYASKDPNPEVAGKGISKIKAAGIEVIGPDELASLRVILDEGQYINRAFFKYIQSQKPWVTLKIASTSDGRMITNPDEPRWITSKTSRRKVHRIRACHQAIITGITTVLTDDCELNVRHKPEELSLNSVAQPQAIILKSKQDFSQTDRETLKIFKHKPLEFTISEQGDFKDLSLLIDHLSSQGLNKIMVEAGPTLSKAFLDADLVDEIIHFEPIEGDMGHTKDKILKRYGALEAKDQVFDSDICISILK